MIVWGAAVFVTGADRGIGLAFARRARSLGAAIKASLSTVRPSYIYPDGPP